MRISLFGYALTIRVESASQYKFWYKFQKGKWATNPHSICKGWWCMWNGILAYQGLWMTINITCETHNTNNTSNHISNI